MTSVVERRFDAQPQIDEDQEGTMTHDRPSARDLARAVGEAAINHGCSLTEPEDPSVAELILQACRVQLRREDVLADR